MELKFKQILSDERGGLYALDHEGQMYHWRYTPAVHDHNFDTVEESISGWEKFPMNEYPWKKSQ